ncbi:MAG: heat-inducible transcription repressor HrcA [Syntrophomonadaceae bacterium]|nr:heat-inducible transcription repressor HrcA [Syntrophomonadaceae bacterium]
MGLLNERKKNILESIIKDYVETAEPVGSRAVVRRHDLKISAATVRNEMADLEEMGYLEQPHASAGRIPSEMGFRYYVDCMMERESLTDEEIEILQKILMSNIHEWDDFAVKIGEFIAQVTNYVSFIIVPSAKLTEFKYLQIIPLKEGKAVMLLVTDTGLIMHRKFEIPELIKVRDLERISKVFNRVFQDKQLKEIRRSDLQILRDDLKYRKKLIEKVLEVIDSVCEDSGSEKVVISGMLNILNEPEFKDLEKLKRVLTLLKEDALLKNIIPEEIEEDVSIKIGRENKIEDIKEMSLVLAEYRTSGETGKLGVMGPIRMEYWKAAGTVESVRSIIEDIWRIF